MSCTSNVKTVGTAGKRKKENTQKKGPLASQHPRMQQMLLLRAPAILALFAFLFSAYFGLFWLISSHMVLLNQPKSAGFYTSRTAPLPPRTDTDPQLAHTAAAHHTHALNGVSCQRAQRRDAHTTSP